MTGKRRVPSYSTSVCEPMSSSWETDNAHQLRLACVSEDLAGMDDADALPRLFRVPYMRKRDGHFLSRLVDSEGRLIEMAGGLINRDSSAGKNRGAG